MSQMLISITSSCDGSEVSSEVSDTLPIAFPAKITYPYRKPTQVVEASSLSVELCCKGTRQCTPRNWEKLGATSMVSRSTGPGQLFIKTQFPAKS